MFETNILNFTRRVEIARHGFESVTLKLASEYDDLKAICAKHGIEISATRVRKVVRKFAQERERSAGWRRILEQTTAGPAAPVRRQLSLRARRAVPRMRGAPRASARLRCTKRRQRSISKSGRLDRPGGVVVGPAAARQALGDRGERLLERRQRLRARGHVLVEAQLAAGPHHAPQLRERGGLAGHRAQHQRGHRRVEIAVRERQGVGHRVDDPDGTAAVAGRFDGLGAQVVLGLHGHQLGHLFRVEREVRTAPGAELDHPPAQAGQQLPAQVVLLVPSALAATRATHRANSGCLT